jgi:dolichol-phosphate mannosyltransferase
MKLISVVIPAYNESNGVNNAYEAVLKVFSNEINHYNYEIIFVDDGSIDDTYYHIRKICQDNKKVKGIKLLNNCGAHTAIRAGLENCTGDMAVFMACDLQDPPEIIFEMAKVLNDPYDIVLAIRKTRGDSMLNKLFSRIFFSIMRKFVSDKIPVEGSSMYLMSNRVLKSLKQFKERNLTLEAMFVLMHYNHITVSYERKAREQGASGWTLSKKIKILVDFFVAYSYAPIRFVTLTGVSIFLIGLFWTVYIVLRVIFVNDLSPGWPALISVITIGFGITNISLGIIAEYLWRTLDESRNRPVYIIDSKENFD